VAFAGGRHREALPARGYLQQCSLQTLVAVADIDDQRGAGECAGSDDESLGHLYALLGEPYRARIFFTAGDR
jgi:hypothetical protein